MISELCIFITYVHIKRLLHNYNIILCNSVPIKKKAIHSYTIIKKNEEIRDVPVAA